jgi:ABC-type Fe3+-hydroxamate transport system substrate-binding protein
MDMNEKQNVINQSIFCPALNKLVNFQLQPKRIVSLVPSQTELLYDLGLDAEVVGITKFCIHPNEWFRSKTRIGGTKNINIEKIKSLNPDLILANKEENVKEQIEALENIAPVWVTDVNNLDDALEMIEMIGTLTSKKLKAESLMQEIKLRFHQLQTCLPDRQAINYQLNTCYLIWKDPYITVGGDTFINDMLNRCGLKNIFEATNRYPETSIQKLASMNCDVVLLSSEPYPFKEKHIEEIKSQLPNTKIVLVDGEMFSWYGSRLLHAPPYFNSLMEELHKK